MWNKISDFLKSHQTVVTIVMAVIAVASIVLLVMIASKYETKQEKNKHKIKKMTTLSLLAAMSIVLYFIKIPIATLIPIMPPFFEIHFSAVPIYLGGYLFGPISGMIIAFLRFFVKLFFSSTMGVGELSDLLIALITVLIAAIIYHRRKTKKAAIVSTFSIIGTWTVTALLVNVLFIMPFYIALYSFDVVFGMLKVIPGIVESKYMIYYLFFAALPFNLLLSSLVSIVTFLTYKKISRFYTDVILHDKNIPTNVS